MQLINTLKQFDPNVLDTDELITLSAQAKLLTSEYATHGLPTPRWLETANRTLAQVIAAKAQAELDRQIELVQAELAGYKTKEEKRDEAQTRLKELLERRGTAPATTPTP